jgi:HSP20 family molecular chaperone IbpA
LTRKEVNLMAEDKLKMAADVCSYVNEDKQIIQLEICVPGVKKERINLKMRDDSYSLFAPRTTSTMCPPRRSAARSIQESESLLQGWNA